MCWLSLVVRSPPARRSLSWIQSTVDWCMAPRNWGFNLKSNSTNYPDHGHHGDPPPTRKNPHGRAGNRTRDLMISSQKVWPLDHEAGQAFYMVITFCLCILRTNSNFCRIQYQHFLYTRRVYCAVRTESLYNTGTFRL